MYTVRLCTARNECISELENVRWDAVRRVLACVPLLENVEPEHVRVGKLWGWRYKTDYPTPTSQHWEGFQRLEVLHTEPGMGTGIRRRVEGRK